MGGGGGSNKHCLLTFFIFLSISLNMCFECSQELSHRDGSFEYQQHMFWLRNKKYNFQLRTLILGPAMLCILRGFKNAPFYILCLFHMIDLRMFSLSFFILLQNRPWFAMILICSCCSFWRNIDVSVFQQLSSVKCEFDSIWKQTLLGGNQMP